MGEQSGEAERTTFSMSIRPEGRRLALGAFGGAATSTHCVINHFYLFAFLSSTKGWPSRLPVSLMFSGWLLGSRDSGDSHAWLSGRKI